MRIWFATSLGVGLGALCLLGFSALPTQAWFVPQASLTLSVQTGTSTPVTPPGENEHSLTRFGNGRCGEHLVVTTEPGEPGMLRTDEGKLSLMARNDAEDYLLWIAGECPEETEVVVEVLPFSSTGVAPFFVSPGGVVLVQDVQTLHFLVSGAFLVPVQAFFSTQGDTLTLSQWYETTPEFVAMPPSQHVFFPGWKLLASDSWGQVWETEQTVPERTEDFLKPQGCHTAAELFLPQNVLGSARFQDCILGPGLPAAATIPGTHLWYGWRDPWQASVL